MKECLTEFEELQEALKKVDMDYDVMPFVRGRLCESESYNKIKKILGTPELIKSHKWCLNLDPEQLSEDEIDKVNRIFQLGLDRGFIEAPKEDSVEALDVEEPEQECPNCEQPIETSTKNTFKAKIPCWTILYSAMKNGEIKTGECFSNACDPRAAKADCLAKLSRFGYENISILALEAGDPDNCGCEETFEAEDVAENDMLDNRNHNLHVSEGEEDLTKTVKCSKCGAVLNKELDTYRFDADGNPICYDCAEEDDVDEDETLDESGNPYLKGMKTANIGGVSSISAKPSKPKTKKATKAIKEEDGESEETSSDDTSAEDSSSDDSADDSTSDDSSSEDTSSDDASEESDEEKSTSDDENAEDSSDDSSEEATDDSSEENSEEDASDDSSEEDTSSDESNDDSSGDSTDSDSSEEGSSDSEEQTNGEDNASEDSSDEDSEDDSSEDDGSEEDTSDEKSDDESKDDLSDEEKTQMKNEYKKSFKSTMEKCKFEGKCFDDLTIEEKIKFFTALQKAWKKNEPQDFMTDKEVEQLNKIVIEK